MSISSQNGRRPTVVVVNSEPEFLHVVGVLLEDEGYRGITMHIRDATFDVIVAADPVVIVVDFVHKQPEAWELLIALDADERTASIPMLATSTDEELLAGVQTRPHERPQVAVLIKPLELDALLDAIRQLCDERAPTP